MHQKAIIVCLVSFSGHPLIIWLRHPSWVRESRMGSFGSRYQIETMWLWPKETWPRNRSDTRDRRRNNCSLHTQLAYNQAERLMLNEWTRYMKKLKKEIRPKTAIKRGEFPVQFIHHIISISASSIHLKNYFLICVQRILCLHRQIIFLVGHQDKGWLRSPSFKLFGKLATHCSCFLFYLVEQRSLQ